jgi:hypothetical protein
MVLSHLATFTRKTREQYNVQANTEQNGLHDRQHYRLRNNRYRCATGSLCCFKHRLYATYLGFSSGFFDLRDKAAGSGYDYPARLLIYALLVLVAGVPYPGIAWPCWSGTKFRSRVVVEQSIPQRQGGMRNRCFPGPRILTRSFTRSFTRTFISAFIFHHKKWRLIQTDHKCVHRRVSSINPSRLAIHIKTLGAGQWLSTHF